MAVVIRLQRLRNTAGSEDIRKFFSGLKIPDGGVHIIGGEREEAFIIFASDEDARRAMTRSGGCIKGSPVDLLLSSKSEMQSILEESTKKLEMNQLRQHKEGFRRHEMGTSPSSENMENRGHRYPEMGNRLVRDPHGEMNPKAESSIACDLYVLLKGMPFSVTEEEVSHFFQGLQIDGVILMKNHRGQNNGMGFVKFRTRRDANEGLSRDREYIGARFVEVYPATEEQWLQADGEMVAAGFDSNPKFRRGPSPAYTQRYQQDRGRSRSPVACRSKSASPSNKEFCVLLENLPYSVQKRDIKELFRHARLQDDQILYLLDGEGKRTRSLFVLFRSQRDYSFALTCHKQEFHNRCLYISSITKEKMIAILETSEHTTEEVPERYSRSQERPLSHTDPYDSERVGLYVRNLPFDVRKVEIMDFFLGFSISEDSVILLRDGKGAGLGEALVVFQTEVEAMTAQSLNGQRFLGSEVMLKCVSRSQMREFGVADPAVKVQTPRERGPQRYSARNSETSHHSRDMGYSDFRAASEDHITPADLQVHIHGGSSLDSNRASPYGQHDGGNGSFHSGFASAAMHFDGPTCLKLVNLPLQITIDEIYDFCYGYRVIPGSVSLQYNRNGVPKGSATVVFESRREALTALEELSGRPIGTKKIKLVFV